MLLADDPCPLVDCGAERLLGVVGEDVLALRQQALDHRIALGRELDNAVRRHVHDPVDHHVERHVAADRDVMDEGQRDQRVGARAFLETLALGLAPTLRRARIGGVEPERRKLCLPCSARSSRGFQRAEIEVEADDLVGAGVEEATE